MCSLGRARGFPAEATELSRVEGTTVGSSGWPHRRRTTAPQKQRQRCNLPTINRSYLAAPACRERSKAHSARLLAQTPKPSCSIARAVHLRSRSVHKHARLVHRRVRPARYLGVTARDWNAVNQCLSAQGWPLSTVPSVPYPRTKATIEITLVHCVMCFDQSKALA